MRTYSNPGMVIAARDSFSSAKSRSPRTRGRQALLRCVPLFWMLSYPLVAGAFQAPEAPADPSQVKPDPVSVDFTTNDGVQVVAEWYAGHQPKDPKPETVPVILVHGLNGKRQDLDGLAKYLQGQGHSVIVPDLRGHGESVNVVGSTKKLSADKLTPAQVLAIASGGGELEKAKQFLMSKHHEKQLNIERLCVVGTELGALLAMRWTNLDWKFPVIATGKQGQDVQGLVLVSPLWSYKSLKVEPDLKTPWMQTQISIYVTEGGRNAEFKKNAERIHKAIEKHRIPPSTATKEEIEKEKNLFIIHQDTKLQGVEMLESEDLNVQVSIGNFIKKRLVDRSIPWRERKNPFAKE